MVFCKEPGSRCRSFTTQHYDGMQYLANACFAGSPAPSAAPSPHSTTTACSTSPTPVVQGGAAASVLLSQAPQQLQVACLWHFVRSPALSLLLPGSVITSSTVPMAFCREQSLYRQALQSLQVQCPFYHQALLCDHFEYCTLGLP